MRHTGTLGVSLGETKSPGRAPSSRRSRRRGSQRSVRHPSGRSSRRLEVTRHSTGHARSTRPHLRVGLLRTSLRAGTRASWKCTTVGRSTETWSVSLRRDVSQELADERLDSKEAQDGDARAKRSPSGGFGDAPSDAHPASSRARAQGPLPLGEGPLLTTRSLGITWAADSARRGAG